MKILFLDFDGVLNSKKYLAKANAYGVIIDPERMVLLKEIIDKTDTKIVLSTSWRKFWEKDSACIEETGKKINEIFDFFGLKIYDKTPELNQRREQEIKAWLDKNKVEAFVVLDDMLLGGDFLKGHFVKTADYLNGLNEQNVIEAIQILNKGI